MRFATGHDGQIVRSYKLQTMLGCADFAYGGVDIRRALRHLRGHCRPVRTHYAGVCERERERWKKRERGEEGLCVCERERESVRLCLFVCEREREEGVFVYVCEREREYAIYLVTVVQFGRIMQVHPPMSPRCCLQGHLAHKKPPHPRTLQ